MVATEPASAVCERETAMGYCLYVFTTDLDDTTEPEELAECDRPTRLHHVIPVFSGRIRTDRAEASRDFSRISQVAVGRKQRTAERHPRWTRGRRVALRLLPKRERRKPVRMPVRTLCGGNRARPADQFPITPLDRVPLGISEISLPGGILACTGRKIQR
jgi:hypothetical protein